MNEVLSNLDSSAHQVSQASNSPRKHALKGSTYPKRTLVVAVAVVWWTWRRWWWFGDDDDAMVRMVGVMMVQLVVVSDGHGGVGRLRWWRWRGGDGVRRDGGRRVARMWPERRRRLEKRQLKRTQWWWLQPKAPFVVVEMVSSRCEVVTVGGGDAGTVVEVIDAAWLWCGAGCDVVGDGSFSRVVSVGVDRGGDV
ncbi:hypothetical protein Tco_0985089 [Tanacetum coccineum]